MHLIENCTLLRKREGTKITDREMKLMARDVSVHFDAIMLQFRAVQTTEHYAASPSINLSAFELPAR